MADDINKILRGVRPEVRDLLLAAHKQGFVVESTGRNHFRILTPPNAKEKGIVHAAGTPSEHRGLRDLRTRLRRIGVNIPH